jgi:hypothetical protein
MLASWEYHCGCRDGSKISVMICVVKSVHPITDSKELGYIGKLALKKTPFFSLMFSISVTAMNKQC